MLSYNTITVVGHVGSKRVFQRANDPTGAPSMVKLTVAVNTDEDEVTWFDVLVWKGHARFAADNVDQGDAVLVEGSIHDKRSSSDEHGGTVRTFKDVHAHRLILLSKKAVANRG